MNMDDVIDAHSPGRGFFLRLTEGFVIVNDYSNSGLYLSHMSDNSDKKTPLKHGCRDAKGRFQPKNSLAIGNKGGGRTPIIRHIRELAREQTETAFAALLEIAMNGKSESARVAALKELFDRGWGKAAQPLVGADGGALEIHHVHKLSDEQLEFYVANGTLPQIIE